MRKFSLLLTIILLVFSGVPLLAQGGSIADIVAGDDNFSTLLQAVEAADPAVLETLSGPGPFTVFAPTNRAFSNLATFLGTDVETLLTDADVLTELLQYHVIPGTYFSSQLAEFDGRTVLTALPNTAIGFTLTEAGVIRLNRVANVVSPFDVQATNGVVHAIDNVVFPLVLQERLQALATGEPAAPEPVTTPEPEPTDEVDTVEGDAFVRVAHFSPDVRGVDIYVDGEITIRRLRFGDVSEWLAVPAGSYEIAVTSSGLPLTVEQAVEGGEEGEVEEVSNALIGPASVDLGADEWVTIAAVGLRGDETLETVVITEDFSPLSAGQTRAVLLHAIPDAPSVDVLALGAPVLNNLTFGNHMALTAPGGNYNLAVVPAGETEPVLIDLPGTQLSSGTYYFVAAVGTADNPSVVITSTSAEEVQNLLGDGDAEDADAGEEATGTGDTAAGGTIADIVANDPNFSLLLQAAQVADPAVLEALSGSASHTVFAPTNEAFENLLAALGVDLDTALALPDLLTPVLLYHVVEGEVLADDVAGMDSATTLEGESITISVEDGGVVLNDSVNVVQTDIQASNGVIHVVDGVLLPQSIRMLLGL